MQAAFLRVKLRRLPEWNATRRRLAGGYRALLDGLPLMLPVERPPARHVYHQFTVRSAQRDALARGLADLGVGTAIHYPTILPAQPTAEEWGELSPGDAPVPRIGEIPEEAQLTRIESLSQSLQEQASEQTREHAHGEEEARPARYPS